MNTLILPFSLSSHLEITEVIDILVEHFIFIRDLNMYIPNPYTTEIFEIESVHNQLGDSKSMVIYNELDEDVSSFVAKMVITSGKGEEYTVKIPVLIKKKRSDLPKDKREKLLQFLQKFVKMISNDKVDTNTRSIYTISIKREGKIENKGLIRGVFDVIHGMIKI